MLGMLQLPLSRWHVGGPLNLVSPHAPQHMPARRQGLLSCSSTHSPLIEAAERNIQPAQPGTIRRIRDVATTAALASSTAPSSYVVPAPHKLTLHVGGQQIMLETGEIGRQANGAVMATMGETVLYATASCSSEPIGDGSFTPLTVNYAERFSAAGRTSGGFIKRDGRPKDAETLVSRLVDRPLRPMFREGWANETQVLEWVLSYDGINSPEPLAITAAAAALLISDIPLSKPVAGVRVGWLDGSPVINPTVQQMETSRLDLMMAGTKGAVLMIEGYCDFLDEEQMLQAITAGSSAVDSMCDALEGWAAAVGKRKRQDVRHPVPPELPSLVRDLVGEQLTKAYKGDLTKEVRGAATEAARQRLYSQLGAPLTASSIGSNGDGSSGSGPAGGAGSASATTSSAATFTHAQLAAALKALESDIMRQRVLQDGVRGDGRGVRDVRPISSRANLLPRPHGSCLFTRGETQAICVATIGSAQDALKGESMRGEQSEDLGRFYLHYHFPPSSVGETGRTGAPGRRELGHGELAQRALAPIIPKQAQFPYTVRLEATITESNGSSSMASVCGGTLALQDAGVPILRPIAGIAMGLILEPDGRCAVLTDILGSEDALGDMDFKVAGDADGVTAFQMDIKVEGITLEIMRQALMQAKEGRRHILTEMSKCTPPPRCRLGDNAPRVIRTMIDATKKGNIIGTGGRTIKQILEVSGATSIVVDEDGTLEVCAPRAEAADKAMSAINLLINDPPIGTIFRSCKVVSLSLYGAFVEISPGRQGLVHVSELDITPVTEVHKVVNAGDTVDVSVLECSNGRIGLSRRAVMLLDAGGVSPASSPVRPSTPSQPPPQFVKSNNGRAPVMGGRGLGSRGDSRGVFGAGTRRP